jgi:hypothetical protein
MDVTIMVLIARSVVQNLGADIGNLTTINLSIVISARKKPDRIAKQKEMYKIVLKNDEKGPL